VDRSKIIKGEYESSLSQSFSHIALVFRSYIVAAEEEKQPEIKEDTSEQVNRLVSKFCEEYPVYRVEPNKEELHNIWAACSGYDADEVASAIYDQFTWGSGEAEWQPRLRALRLLDHFSQQGAPGALITESVLDEAKEMIRYLADHVPKCRAAAAKMLHLKGQLATRVATQEAGAPAVRRKERDGLLGGGDAAPKCRDGDDDDWAEDDEFEVDDVQDERQLIRVEVPVTAVHAQKVTGVTSSASTVDTDVGPPTSSPTTTAEPVQAADLTKLTVVFEPYKKVGIDADWQSGLVNFVDEAHQAHRLGVRVGMRLVAVASKPYTIDRYHKARANGASYFEVTFAQVAPVEPEAAPNFDFNDVPPVAVRPSAPTAPFAPLAPTSPTGTAVLPAIMPAAEAGFSAEEMSVETTTVPLDLPSDAVPTCHRCSPVMLTAPPDETGSAQSSPPLQPSSWRASFNAGKTGATLPQISDDLADLRMEDVPLEPTAISILGGTAVVQNRPAARMQGWMEGASLEAELQPPSSVSVASRDASAYQRPYLWLSVADQVQMEQPEDKFAMLGQLVK